MMSCVDEIPEDQRQRLWTEASDDKKFLAALTTAGYGHTRLAGQVNLLVHIRDRGRQLGWPTYTAICNATHISEETLRKLRVIVREMQDGTAVRIADGLGWTRDSIETMLAGGEPTAITEWKPYGERVAHSAVPDPRRGVFDRLDLDPGNLDVVLRRYDLGDPRTRRIAAAIARVLTEEIDPIVRDHLLRAARNFITRTLAAEQEHVDELEAQLDALPGGGQASTA